MVLFSVTSICADKLSQVVMGRLDNWTWGKWVHGGRRQFHISLLADLPACSCAILGPPVEGSQQHRELGGGNTQSPVLKKNGEALMDRAWRPKRGAERTNVWRLSGSVSLDAGLNTR